MNQITYLYHTLCEALDSGKEVRAVFCDISKAFDRVWHAGLLYRLEAAGVTGEVLNWFQSYLSDRRQRVCHTSRSILWMALHQSRRSSSLNSLTYTLLSIYKWQSYWHWVKYTPFCWRYKPFYYCRSSRKCSSMLKLGLRENYKDCTVASYL